MKVQVKTNAAEEAARLDRMARNFGQLAAAEVQATARDALPSIRQGTPVDSGQLRDSWTVRDTRKGARATNDARYAEFVGDLEQVAENAFADALKARPDFDPERTS